MSRIIASGASSQGFEADGSKGNAGEFLKTQGDGLPPVWGEVVSDRTLIATVDLAGASVAEFDGLFSTAYADFEFVLETIQNTTRTFGFDAQYKKAGAWISSAYSSLTSHLYQGNSASTVPVYAYDYPNLDSLRLIDNPDANVGEINLNTLASLNGIVKISNPNVSLAHNMSGDFVFNSGTNSTLRTYPVKSQFVGYHQTGGILEGVRFQVGGAGTWSSGKIHLYGIRPL